MKGRGFQIYFFWPPLDWLRDTAHEQWLQMHCLRYPMLYVITHELIGIRSSNLVKGLNIWFVMYDFWPGSESLDYVMQGFKFWRLGSTYGDFTATAQVPYHVTDLSREGQKQLLIWNPRPHITLHNFYWATIIMIINLLTWSYVLVCVRLLLQFVLNELQHCG